ncbi:MAG: class I SAM-dependent methyltransferase [Candidatus Dormibacteria bacterium]
MSSRFQTAYLEGSTPWDIGAPQSVFVRLFEAGAITGRVIDAGCGTGENVLYLASQGVEVVGVDGAPVAIARAQAKAAERGITAGFEVADVLDLHALDGTFDCGIDSGCFHVFNDDDRARYVHSVHGALRSGARMFILCFSDRQPGTWGPRRVTQAELRDAFSDGWRVDEIEAASFDVNVGARSAGAVDRPSDTPVAIEAWLALLTRA